MSERKPTLSELAVLAHFNLDPDDPKLPQEYTGKTTVDGEDFDLEEPEEEHSHCHACDGSGQGRHGGTCPECRGWGVLPTEAELEEAAEREIDDREW